MTDKIISGAVEGLIDDAVLRRLIGQVGAISGAIYNRGGKTTLLKTLQAYNKAAQYVRWAILIDLDQDYPCAVAGRKVWLPTPARYMCFRIAVREIESWLLADREQIAEFLSVPVSQVPEEPDILPNPKQGIVNLARKSRKKAIREDIVPRPGSGRDVGPAYTSQMVEFTIDHWRPAVAVDFSESLRRCLQCLHNLTVTTLDNE